MVVAMDATACLIPLSDLRPGLNYRRPEARDLTALADSIGARGFDPAKPLTGYRDGDTVRLIGGHCRLTALAHLVAAGEVASDLPIPVVLRDRPESELAERFAVFADNQGQDPGLWSERARAVATILCLSADPTRAEGLEPSEGEVRAALRDSALVADVAARVCLRRADVVKLARSAVLPRRLQDLLDAGALGSSAIPVLADAGLDLDESERFADLWLHPAPCDKRARTVALVGILISELRAVAESADGGLFDGLGDLSATYTSLGVDTSDCRAIYDPRTDGLPALTGATSLADLLSALVATVAAEGERAKRFGAKGSAAACEGASAVLRALGAVAGDLLPMAEVTEVATEPILAEVREVREVRPVDLSRPMLATAPAALGTPFIPIRPVPVQDATPTQGHGDPAQDPGLWTRATEAVRTRRAAATERVAVYRAAAASRVARGFGREAARLGRQARAAAVTGALSDRAVGFLGTGHGFSRPG